MFYAVFRHFNRQNQTKLQRVAVSRWMTGTDEWLCWGQALRGIDFLSNVTIRRWSRRISHERVRPVGNGLPSDGTRLSIYHLYCAIVTAVRDVFSATENYWWDWRLLFSTSWLLIYFDLLSLLLSSVLLLNELNIKSSLSQNAQYHSATLSLWPRIYSTSSWSQQKLFITQSHSLLLLTCFTSSV